MKIAIRRRRKQSGNVLIESALGLLILVSIFSGTFDFGFTFWQYNVLQTAINNGAHYAGQLAWDYCSTCTLRSAGDMTTAYETAVRNEVVYGDPTGTLTRPVLTGLTTSYVTVTANNQTGSLKVPTSITVTMGANSNGNYYTISSLWGGQNFYWKGITMSLNGKPSLTYPFQGFVTAGY